MRQEIAAIQETSATELQDEDLDKHLDTIIFKKSDDDK